MANEIVPPDADQPNVLHALTRKRAEIAGRIEQSQSALRDLVEELEHVDATIRIFNPDINVGAIRPKSAPLCYPAFHGELTQLVFRMLREAGEPVTCRDILLRLMKQRGLDPSDKKLWKVMVLRVRACLRMHREKGRIRSVQLVGSPLGWEAVR